MVITGDKIILRPMKEDDFDLLFGWLNNPKVMTYWYGSDKPHSREWIRKHFSPSIRGLKNWNYWMIELRGEPIGYICNTEENDDGEFLGRVELDILIGDKSEWERGYGTDALKAMLSYAFNTQKAERVFLIPRAINPRAIRVYKKVGFKQEGILRHHEKFEGKWIDGVMLAILKDEFNQ